jgi:hypothetical protein
LKTWCFFALRPVTISLGASDCPGSMSDGNAVTSIFVV